jgi:IS30 family transposase
VAAPTNENTNGLLRQYFPKGTDLRPHTPQRLAEVAAQLNTRPRKTLGRRTPAQLFNALAAHQPDTLSALQCSEVALRR